MGWLQPYSSRLHILIMASPILKNSPSFARISQTVLRLTAVDYGVAVSKNDIFISFLSSIRHNLLYFSALLWIDPLHPSVTAQRSIHQQFQLSPDDRFIDKGPLRPLFGHVLRDPFPFTSRLSGCHFFLELLCIIRRPKPKWRESTWPSRPKKLEEKAAIIAFSVFRYNIIL